MTTEAENASARPEVALNAVKNDLPELLRRYRTALKFAGDMPMLGRYGVSESTLGRLGSRFFTRVYVETHIRKQLLAIRDCLRLELLGMDEGADRQKITALVEELERDVEPLFRWRRLTGLVARLPPVAAALPIISAATAWPLADDVSPSTVLHALLVLVGTALALWILVVWPSVRLGFRVKRVILAGGEDLRHPLLRAESVKWGGFSEGSMAFPTDNAYAAENSVYRALGRKRKPAEVPLDLLLGLGPYFWLVYSVFFFWGLVDVIVEGELWETTKEGHVGLFFAGALALGPVALFRHGRKNYGQRRH